MRLTRKNEFAEQTGMTHVNNKPIYLDEKKFNESLDAFKEIINKLGQLEDIEDELGLSLVLLNQIRHSKQVYVKNDNNEIVVGYVDSINIRKYIFRGRYKGISDLKKGFIINFRDYGSKIALTKEELEK